MRRFGRSAVHARWRIVLGLGAASVAWLSLATHTPRALAQEATTSQTSPTSDEIDKLVDQLGDESYTLREEATRQLFVHGAPAVPRLQERLARETDPEVRHRLRYILENIVPPRQAVLVIRAAPETELQPGDVITHANSRRVRDASEFRQYLISSPLGVLLRVHRAAGPREVGPVEVAQLIELNDYVAPRGERLAEAVRLYATGFAEQAYAIVCGLPQPIPEAELSEPLRARLAYTAGDAASAITLMANHTELLRASGADWSSPSYFDLLGPGKAPLHLEWVLATQAGPGFYATNNDPDLRVQRILLPANRCADALELSIGYWWRRYRAALGSDDDANRVGGNQLAVAAWMLYALDLRSECCRLIEPRSAILRQSRLGNEKWVRVETDAWLPFFAGDPQAALDRFCEPALDILQHPPRPNEQSVLTRNPQVAARVAFFLYQFPDDPRVEKGLRSVSHHLHPALTEYLDWMLYALCEKNLAAVRRDLQAILPHVSDQDVLPYARALALLEYVQARPDLEILRTARQRMAQSPVGQEREVWLAIVDALLELCQHRPDEARKALESLRERPEASVLWQTVEFLCAPPPSAANQAALQQPVLAVPMGPSREHWLIFSRDRRLMRFDAGASLLTALERPTPTWFPNPVTWPWLGREQSSGRVWVYCRRRVIEIMRDAQAAGLRLNLQPADISAFDRYISPHFSELAQAVAADTLEPGENSEFLRREIKANAEYCADPDLPEIGMIEHVNTLAAREP